MRPHYSHSSRENATPSSGTSPLGSRKGVPPGRKRHLRSEFALLQTGSSLFHIVQFVNCWQILLNLSSKRLYRNSGKDRESRCLAFTSFTKREIGLSFTSQSWRDGKELNLQINVRHSTFWRSRCRPRPRRLSSLFFGCWDARSQSQVKSSRSPLSQIEISNWLQYR